MMQVDWDLKEGWGKPQITPFGPIPIHPFNSSLHYAV